MSEPDFARRDLMRLTAAVAIAGGLGAPAYAVVPADTPMSPRTPADAHMLWARLNGDLSGRTVLYFNHGTVWGFKPQADDLTVEDFAKRLYGYSGVAARKMLRQPDGSVRVRQKFWAFYRDPLSDAITDRIPNPYTGVTDIAAPMGGVGSERVLGVPPAAGYAMEAAKSAVPYDMRIRRLGARAWVETSGFNRLRPGGIDWWKLEGQLENYACATRDLDDPAITHVPSTLSQNVIAEWQTWTKMHGAPGHILFKGDGAPLYDLADLPADTLAAIDRFFPGTLADVRTWDR